MKPTKTPIKILLAAILALAAALPAQADRYRSDLYARMQRIEERIEHGLRSGELTHREVRHLDRERNEIHAIFRSFRSDHHLSHRERQILEVRLDRLSAEVAALNNNHRDRWDRARYDRNWH